MCPGSFYSAGTITDQQQQPFEAERDENGHFLSRPPSITGFTPETARSASLKRWEMYREAAADAVTEKVGKLQPGVTTPEAAWGVLNGRLAEQIHRSDKPRGDDLRVLGQNMGAIPNAYERTEMENPSLAGLLAAALNHETAQALKVLAEIRERQLSATSEGTIDAQVLRSDILNSQEDAHSSADGSTPQEHDPHPTQPAAPPEHNNNTPAGR